VKPLLKINNMNIKDLTKFANDCEMQDRVNAFNLGFAQGARNHGLNEAGYQLMLKIAQAVNPDFTPSAPGGDPGQQQFTNDFRNAMAGANAPAGPTAPAPAPKPAAPVKPVVPVTTPDQMQLSKRENFVGDLKNFLFQNKSQPATTPPAPVTP
jgi:hypothetical protein